MIAVNTIDIPADAPEARFAAAFERNRPHILNGRGQPLAEKRNQALTRFLELGFPGPRHEQWKYTNISRRLDRPFDVAIAPVVPDLKQRDTTPFRIEGLDASVAILINGVMVAGLSSVRDDGPTIMPIMDAIGDHTFSEHFGRYADIENAAFTSLNTAFARHGLFVRADRNTKSGTLHILNLTTELRDTFLQPRHLFVVDAGASLTVIETHASLNAEGVFHNAVAEAAVGSEARFDYYRIQQDPGASAVTGTYIYQEGSSYASCATVTLAGTTIRNNVSVLPDAQHCESHLTGLFIGTGEMHIDNHTLVDHAKPDCFSNELYKGVLNDSATGVFNGRVLVRRDAQRTNAYQSNKSILLSDRASMNAKPELEIYADDVKCSHGATTGRLDAEGLFYLRSRGLSTERARTIMLQAFIRDVLDNVPIEPLRQQIGRGVEERLTR